MKTSFDYIDDVVEKSTKAEPKLSDKERGEAGNRAKKIIGGFRVKDDKAEKDALDVIVARKRSGIETFLKDRSTAKEALKACEIKPMAVVPTKAWEKICYDTGLYIMAPDKQGRVTYDIGNLQKLNGYKDIDFRAKKDWKWFLDTAFPQRKSVPVNTYYCATLVLPDPPEDVAAILCKAQALTLKVAAVAEAISFVEKPSEIVKRSSVSAKDLWAQARGYEDYKDWVKRDPIVFCEYGTATAIIAQFGDFPIEKEVVDAVMATNDLLPEGINPAVATTNSLGWPTVEDQYRRTMELHQQAYVQQMGTLGNAPQYYGIGGSASGVMPYTISSQSWTGR